jgi:hypothetical protein
MTMLEIAFPYLAREGSRVTSPVDAKYNCVAWAAGDTTRWWWPDADPINHWPAGVPREETLAAFVAAFATLGYTPTADGTLQPGVVKVAVYAKAGLVTHVARQLPTGLWTSKLGHSEDIEHTLDGLAGAVFGQVVVVLAKL